MNLPAGGRSAPVILLVDVERAFADGRACRTARSADQAIALLREFEFGPIIEQLWLDHDLGWLPSSVPITAQPLVDELVRAADEGTPYAIGEIRIHGRNPRGIAKIKSELENAGYRVVREYDLRVLTRDVRGDFGAVRVS